MTHQPDPASRLRALAAAIAVTTATSYTGNDLSVEELLGDIDPLEVVSVLAAALHAALDLVLGDAGRQSVLQRLALGAAQKDAQ
jgi:hypothetical protein